MIEQTAEVVAQRIAPEEAEAISIVWQNRGHAEEYIPAPDALDILAEVRARKEKIEADVLALLQKSIGENRRSPRRHQLFAFYVLFAIFAIGIPVFMLIVRFFR